MPRKKGQAVLMVIMSPAELESVHALARKRRFKITSDYVRGLIEADAKDAGVEMKFVVDRGTHHQKKETNEPKS